MLEKEKPTPTKKGTVLGEKERKDLLEPKIGYYSNYRQIDLPNFQPGEVGCDWSVNFGNNGLPNYLSVVLFIESGKVKIADIDVEIRNGIWYIFHRFVQKEMRGKGVGASILATMEDLISAARARDAEGLPDTVGLTTSMPTLISFLLSQDYHSTEEGEKRWNRFLAERDDPANAEAFKDRGELPSFLLAKLQLLGEDGKPLDTLERDEVIIDKEALEEYGPNPGIYTLTVDNEEGDPTLPVRSNFKLLKKRFVSTPFLLSLDLRKKLP